MSTLQVVSQQIPVGTWQSDPAHSHVEFAVKHLGIATVRGRFGDFEATLVGGDEPSLSGVIRTSSIDTHDETRDQHLRSPEFFDSERYPEARIEALRIEDGTITADLTIKDLTREVELTAETAGPVEDPFGNLRLGLDLEGEIDRTDFGLTWNAPLPGGGFLVGSTVRLSASLSFVQAA